MSVSNPVPNRTEIGHEHFRWRRKLNPEKETHAGTTCAAASGSRRGRFDHVHVQEHSQPELFHGFAGRIGVEDV